MINKPTAQTTIKDCTIFKLGGSYAVSLNKDQIEKAGLALGMPVNVTLKFYEDNFEPIPDHTDEIDTIENLFKNYEEKHINEISTVAEEFGLIKFPGKMNDTPALYRSEIKEELQLQLDYMKKEMEEIEASINDYSESDLDYDKQGEKLLENV